MASLVVSVFLSVVWFCTCFSSGLNQGKIYTTIKNHYLIILTSNLTILNWHPCGCFCLQGVQSHLIQYVLVNAADLTYERLSREIDNMVGQDRNWSNFVMAMNVAKRVCLETSKASSAVKGYFQHYISHSYSQAMQQAGGVVS